MQRDNNPKDTTNNLKIPNGPELNPTIVTIAHARTVNCSLFHALICKQLGISKATITIQPCMIDGRVYLNQSQILDVPDEDVLLSSICTPGHEQYLVRVDYVSRLDPSTLMTRGEFVLEMLGIWETMRRRVSPHAKEIGAELDMVITYVQSVYAVTELMNLDYLDTGTQKLLSGATNP